MTRRGRFYDRGVEKSVARRYRGPSISGTVAVLLGVLGLGIDLPDLVIYIGVGTTLLVTAMWALAIRTLPRLQNRLLRWVSKGLEDLSGENELEGYPMMARHRAQGDWIARRERGKLRGALNEVSAELEEIQQRVESDDAAYWIDYDLPLEKWQEHSRFIAEHETEAHRALRQAYLQAERLQHFINGRCHEVSGLDGRENQDLVMETVTVRECAAPGPFKATSREALRKVTKAVGRLTDSP